METHGRLEDKTAIVTGAGRGIGAAIAELFAHEGASVTIAEIDAGTGQAVADRLCSEGLDARFARTDVTDTDDIRRTVDAVIKAQGRIDILVNNAGANVFYEPHEMPEGEWRRCFDLDLDAAWHFSRAVLESMRARGRGDIVNIASGHSFKIIPHTFPYPVAKHALVGLTRSLGVEYAAQGIRVNAIAPGYIETDIAVDYWNTFDDPDAERQRAYDLHPPKRIGTPREVAYTALFLASDEARFINAETISIDGGRSVLYHD